MALPIELEQLTPLQSVTLSPFFDSLIKAIFANTVNKNWGEIFRNFWLLLPDYAVAIMMKLFTFSFLLALLLVVFIIWTSNNIVLLRRKIHDSVKLPNQEVAGVLDYPKPVENEKWQKVIIHINSTNPSDWKLAILECDIMLGEILEKMGYMQPSIGDKLKAVEPSDFTNIESAWEAHKIRNSIAHEGSEFLINEREAKRVIGLYEVVFREFEYI